MSTVSAYAALSANAPLIRTSISRRRVGPFDVAVDIKYCGICHSDIHTVTNEWGEANYPVVPGHEIAGVVSSVGSGVTKFIVGDRVGVGCFVDSCRECGACTAGFEQYCSGQLVATYNAVGADGQSTQGGYSGAIVVDENYLLHIPDALPLEGAAPLLCAGITTYSPLRHWKAGPGSRVAVIGLGGLGHLAVKLAAAMGAEVSVLSQSLKKMEDGRRLGATHYYATDDRHTFAELRNSFDLILNTVSANFDLGQYLELLDLDGTMVQLGMPERQIYIPPLPLILKRRTFAGSGAGGIAETQEMLNFCAERSIAADIEVIEPDYINAAYGRVLASDVRYRFVIDTTSL